ncbi:caspase-7-like [Leguminivora glycinivorella]|uniref:caspase-7-like n=1 Tax=Leguminivora glycinivorella TaxID=1035111 RepID=UPI00200E09C5|nr:caspase-7-like [Leguminivora glycinivorella]
MASPTQLRLAVPGNLKVIPSSVFMKDNGREIKLYYSRGLQRGALVIFSFSEFTTGEERREIDSDISMLKDLFKQIGFSYILHCENHSKEETMDILKKLRLEGYDCVFFVVSSHGYGRDGMWDTEIRCTNGGLISTHEIVNLFIGENYPELIEIPKVFIFQMCRGKKLLPNLQGALTDISNCTQRVNRQNSIRGSSYSDILIAYSTLPGFVSPLHRGNSKLSWFIQALCSVFAAHAHNHHVIDLFRLVVDAMKQLCPAAVPTLEIVDFKKDLYLHPGLAEDEFGNIYRLPTLYQELVLTFGRDFRWYTLVCTVLRLYKLYLLHGRE